MWKELAGKVGRRESRDHGALFKVGSWGLLLGPELRLQLGSYVRCRLPPLAAPMKL
jgi:hypothetical protein